MCERGSAHLPSHFPFLSPQPSSSTVGAQSGEKDHSAYVGQMKMLRQTKGPAVAPCCVWMVAFVVLLASSFFFSVIILLSS